MTRNLTNRAEIKQGTGDEERDRSQESADPV